MESVRFFICYAKSNALAQTNGGNMHLSARFSDQEFNKLKALLNIYEWGLKTIMTKFEIIHEDLVTFHTNHAIDQVRCRLKEPLSIAQKLDKMGVDITVENAKNLIKDIAGVRIITPFTKDIFYIVNLIRYMPDVTILEEKNYISHPKDSGYRSYHLIVEVPIFYSGKMDFVPIEIQIRTEAMNFWASLEHKARYKYNDYIPEYLCEELVAISNVLSEMDHRMFLINEIIGIIQKDI